MDDAKRKYESLSKNIKNKNYLIYKKLGFKNKVFNPNFFLHQSLRINFQKIEI
jgi:hypothetical protein